MKQVVNALQIIIGRVNQVLKILKSLVEIKVFENGGRPQFGRQR